MCRHSANNENSRRTPEKPLVPRVSGLRLYPIYIGPKQSHTGSTVSPPVRKYLPLTQAIDPFLLESNPIWFATCFDCKDFWSFDENNYNYLYWPKTEPHGVDTFPPGKKVSPPDSSYWSVPAGVPTWNPTWFALRFDCKDFWSFDGTITTSC